MANTPEKTSHGSDPAKGSGSSRHDASEPARTSAWYRLHLWEVQPVRDILLVALVIGVIYLGHAARVVTIPMLLALFLAYLCDPLVRLMRRKLGVSRRAASIGILVGAFFVVVVPLTLGAGFAAVQATKAVRAISENVSHVQASVAKPDDVDLRDEVPRGAWRSIRDFIIDADKRRMPAKQSAPLHPPKETVPGSIATVPAEPGAAWGEGDMHSLARLALGWLEEHGSELGQALGQRVVGGGAQAVSAAVSATVGAGFVIFAGLITAFFFFFFSTHWESVQDWFRGLIPEHHRERTLHLLGRMDRVIAGFVRGRLLICCILGVYMTIAYYLAGVPAWLVLGPFIGLCFIVPFMHAIGMPLAMLLMWLDQSAGAGDGTTGTAAHWAFERAWWWVVLAPMGIYLGAQLLDDYFLTPRIQGKTTDMSVPMIVFASLAGGAIGGLYGLLIAIPVAACVKILAQEVFWPRVRAWVRGEAKDILPIGKG